MQVLLGLRLAFCTAGVCGQTPSPAPSAVTIPSPAPGTTTRASAPAPTTPTVPPCLATQVVGPGPYAVYNTVDALLQTPKTTYVCPGTCRELLISQSLSACLLIRLGHRVVLELASLPDIIDERDMLESLLSVSLVASSHRACAALTCSWVSRQACEY